MTQDLRITILRICMVSWFSWVFCACAWAQQPRSGMILAGELIDPSDAPVASTLVRLLSSTVEAETLTGARGEFRFANLTPGEYEVQVDLKGFAAIRRKVRLG